MANRTIAIGDIHGDIGHLRLLLAKLPTLDRDDTLVFLGDYIDRGPDSAGVVRLVRELETTLPCRVVSLMGNHEDAWLRVIDRGWPEFVLPAQNGCLATMRSFVGGSVPEDGAAPEEDELPALHAGTFFPEDVVAWMRALPLYYEDAHAIYVHAGLIERNGEFAHPSETEPKAGLLWTRSENFFRNYRGKRTVVGHTNTELLPPELSSYTPSDPCDLWAGPGVVAIDTGAGSGGFLTAVEFPSQYVYESRSA